MFVVLIRARAQCTASLPQVESIRTAPRFQLPVGVMRIAKSRWAFPGAGSDVGTGAGTGAGSDVGTGAGAGAGAGAGSDIGTGAGAGAGGVEDTFVSAVAGVYTTASAGPASNSIMLLIAAAHTVPFAAS
jgi:hypothetical protein